MKHDSFQEYVSEMLEPLGEIECRRMFSGYGIYRGDVFFGIISKAKLFFKVGPLTQKDYLAKGRKPFRPSVKQVLKTYYEVPADVLEDADELKNWALRAVEEQKKIKKEGRF
ncbi:MAG: TfoX/Sxy family protein [Chlamydiae bacterium]|nr:TfoX/Sxy family protein [Chlamydiota bacterium]MBI3265569.1 TfoX/Sxy family protein [Chlamydiota bacterium]